MGANSKIEWTDHTFNPWRGCAHVHTGCVNCYAERMSVRNPAVLGVWGAAGTRVVAAEKTWQEPLKWDRAAAKVGERHRVFCASLADVFEDWNGRMLDSDGATLHEGKAWFTGKHWVGINDVYIGKSIISMADVRRRLFDFIDATPNLDWLLVTKRPENIAKMWPGGFRKNVWLLTSVSNQETADTMIPPLLECRNLAPVLGLSMEPLVGPVDLLSVGWPGTDMGDRHRVDVLRFGYWCKHPHMFASPSAQIGERKGGFVNHSNMHDNYGKLSWVIVGGESGNSGTRPMRAEWAIDIRDQCQAAGVPFFFKQGSQSNWINFKDFDSFPLELRVREFPKVSVQ